MGKLRLMVSMCLIIILSGCVKQTPVVHNVSILDSIMDKSSTGEVQRLPYDVLINHITDNLTSIILSADTNSPIFGTRYAQGFGFTSKSHVYVDFEDGANHYRALLHCTQNPDLDCEVLAIFARQLDQWALVLGLDTESDNPIVYRWTRYGNPRERVLQSEVL